jgi:TetR/AcrR family tetracycline transcriptional repressor
VAEKLNRAVIARAALRLLDATGIDGITMRALAAELGVQAPTLYWHVKSKQDIFRAMAAAMSEDAAALMTAADRRAPGRECIARWAHALRRTMLSHRDGARVFAGTFATDPATLDVIESVLDAWREAGVSTADAAQRTALLRNFIVGFCIEEQALAELRGESGRDQREEMRASADPARFPLTVQAFPAILTTPADERFELGMRLMLSGTTADDRHHSDKRLLDDRGRLLIGDCRSGGRVVSLACVEQERCPARRGAGHHVPGLSGQDLGVRNAVPVEVCRPPGEFRPVGHAQGPLDHFFGDVLRVAQGDQRCNAGQRQHDGEAGPVLVVMVELGEAPRPENGLEPGRGVVEISHWKGHVMQPRQRRWCHRHSKKKGRSRCGWCSGR